MNNEIPNIVRACKEIAYDNGMINRYTTEDVAVAEMLDRIKGFTLKDILSVEEELSRLSEEHFQLAIEGLGVSYLANDLLNAAFEGIE
jgi:hypothetical protein